MEVTKIPKRVVTVIEPKQRLVVDKEKYAQQRVAAYCRVSTDSEEQLTSYTTQKKVYTEMIAKRTDWCLAGIYADEGISGTRADKRPEFNKMINDCLKGKIDYIITKSVSRFARNTVECLEFVRMLKSRGIGIYFEEQNIDTLKNESELYLVIYAGFAQAESESMSKNITWSKRKSFEEGKPAYVYKQWLGYRKGADGQPEIVPEEAKIVERVFNMYLSGMPVNVISKTLQSENIQIPGKNMSFGKCMIINMIRNEKYCGDCILQKTVTIDCISKIRRKNTGEAPMYYVQNCHPAIISREIFNRTQEEIARRKAKTPASTKQALTAVGKYSKFALTEVLVCAECGSRYKRCTWVKKGVKLKMWRCVNRVDYGSRYCKKSPTLEESKLHESIVRALNKFNAKDRNTYLSLMKATIGEAIGLNGYSDEINLLERKIEALNKKTLEFVNDSIKNGTDIAEYEEELRSISEEAEAMKRRIKVIKENEDDGSNDERLITLQETIDERDKNIDKYDDSIVRQMIECIKVYSDGRLDVIFGGGIVIKERFIK